MSRSEASRQHCACAHSRALRPGRYLGQSRPGPGVDRNVWRWTIRRRQGAGPCRIHLRCCARRTTLAGRSQQNWRCHRRAAGGVRILRSGERDREHARAADRSRHRAQLLTTGCRIFRPCRAPETIGPGEVFTGADVISRDEFTSTAFYNELWRPGGLSADPLVTNLFAESAASGHIASHGPLNQSPFDSSQKRLFATLAQHLVRAVALQRRVYHMTIANERALTGLEGLRQGFLLVDAAGPAAVRQSRGPQAAR